MAERVKVTVRASDAHPDVLTVQDAMRQVLDFFDLLSGDETDSKQIAWRLISASTNSPFTAEGEAISLVPNVDVAIIARAQKVTLSRDFAAVKSGRIPDALSLGQRSEKLKRILERNTNGVGGTEVTLYDGIEPVVITPREAKAAIAIFEQPANEPAVPPLLYNRAREERGSVEGLFIDVGTHYNSPAIRIIERKTRAMVWCRIDDDIKTNIAEQANFMDVWSRRRIKVKGRIKYDARGRIVQIQASGIERIMPRAMTPNDIYDPDFTEGIPTSEYLELLREGEVAQ